MKRLRSRLNLLIHFLLIAALCCGCRPLAQPNLSVQNSSQGLLGDPSPVLTHNSTRYVSLTRPQYALLYDRTKNTAVWASWQLNQSWLGHLTRPPFAPDPALSGQVITPNDYTGSGFDRGHLVPAADRNRTPEDAAAVFYMSNIVPQAPDHNQGPWEALESYCRSLVRAGKELYIIAGPMGTGGIGSKGKADWIAENKVQVPSAVWKIIVVNHKPGLGLDGLSNHTRVIAVLMPNQQGIKEKDWRLFRTTVQDLEQQTGYNFLSNVPQPLQNTLETRLDQ